MCDQRQCGRICFSLCISGSLLLLLSWSSVTEAQDDYYGDTATAPDYSDYNATFDYSFYSNASTEDLENFLNEGTDVDQEDEDGGEEEVTATMTTFIRTTVEDEVQTHCSAAPPTLVSMTVLHTLLWILSLILQQLEHTL